MIKTTITSDWRQRPPPDDFLVVQGDRWHISLPEQASVDRLVAEFARTPDSKVLAMAGTLLAVLVLLIPISLFAVIGNGLYDVLKESDPGGRVVVVLVVTLAIYLLLAALAAGSQRLPLLSQELEVLIEGFRDITHRFHLRPARLRRQANSWAKAKRLDQAVRVDVWNPGMPTESGQARGGGVFWTVLLPLLNEKLADGSILVLHVRHDEVPAVRDALTAFPVLDVDAVVPTPELGEPRQVSGSVLSAEEMQLVRLLRISSFPLADLTGDALAGGQDVLCFSENFFLGQCRWLADAAVQANAFAFLARCREDYGYLRAGEDGIEMLHLPPALEAATAADCRRLSARAGQLLVSDPRRYLNGGDPFPLLATINALAVLHDAHDGELRFQENMKQQIGSLVVETLAAIEQGEHYPLFAHFARREFGADAGAGLIARHLPLVMAPQAADSQVSHRVAELTRFNSFDTDTLMRLARLLEICGLYEGAIGIWRKLEILDPQRACIRLARLAERQGHAAEGFERLRTFLAGDDSDWRSDIRIQALLEGAWLAYSAQGEGRLAQGRAWLDAVRSLLDNDRSHCEYRWRYHNYRALYLDTEGEFVVALEEHRTALRIPGVHLKWYSGSLVNLAYVGRKLALHRLHDGQGSAVEVAGLLAEAAEHAQLAVGLKTRIGDTDELPVALHNLALAELCRALVSPGVEPTALATVAMAAIERGLGLLDATGSTKKRFALLVERALANRLLGHDATADIEAAATAPMTAREVAVLGEIRAASNLASSLAMLESAVLRLELLD